MSKVKAMGTTNNRGAVSGSAAKGRTAKRNSPRTAIHVVVWTGGDAMTMRVNLLLTAALVCILQNRNLEAELHLVDRATLAKASPKLKGEKVALVGVEPDAKDTHMFVMMVLDSCNLYGVLGNRWNWWHVLPPKIFKGLKIQPWGDPSSWATPSKTMRIRRLPARAREILEAANTVRRVDVKNPDVAVLENALTGHASDDIAKALLKLAEEPASN